MIGGINNFTTSSGAHLIIDYKDMICHTGMMVGTAIYKLNTTALCSQTEKKTIWEKYGTEIYSAIGLFLVMCVSACGARRCYRKKYFNISSSEVTWRKCT